MLFNRTWKEDFSFETKTVSSCHQGNTQTHNFPSLASILGEDDDSLSDEDGRFDRDSVKSKTTNDEVHGEQNSVLQIDINEQRNYDGHLLLNGEKSFNKVSIFYVIKP